ncbi:ATP-dependent DNA helicase RecQ [Shewanella sp. KT0246]|uniref:RecQ family ATP-dependent DNA helicase n=1 Tax=Shewanella sp. KT0246 TaxID=2815912 RepID=UPI001BC009B8|nr:ATP-dependent DNA helicase RecQ [Shewanella sp. KT0246]GIU54108.1 ATP-dependent DNA helicase RecQ [Shewanella sp. KT0246]
MLTPTGHSPVNISELSASLQQRLKQQFGFEQFREGQQAVIEHILSGHSSLAIFPTGSGKSLCYQFSALQLANVTLVVSPLLALMKDQIAFLNSKGIHAASIDSNLTYDQSQQVMRDVRSGQTKILMVSVERFKNERFRQFLSSISISLLVVDEAHCISEWGHNFRPDYLKIPVYCQEFAIPQVLLLTATATAKVKQDMAERFNILPQQVVQTGFYRSNLDISVLPVLETEKNAALLEKVHQHNVVENSAGIIYVTLQKTAEEVAQFLNSQGIRCTAYHAGLESDMRNGIQNRFMADEINVIVATIAFGMGIDKSNIRFVIHYDLPKSIENYSQEIGRAGRDNKLSHCVTLANKDGLSTIENFVYGDTPEPSAITKLIQHISVEVDNGRWEMQESAISSSCNIKLLPLKTLLVQLELAKVVKPSFAYFAEFKYQFLVDKHQVLASFDEQRQTFLNQIFEHTQFKKIWGQLDFDSLFQQYGAQRQRVVAALEYLADKQMILLETKKITQVFDVNPALLVQQDLVEHLSNYFQSNEVKEIARLNQLLAFFESPTCITSRLARYFDDKAAPKQCGHCSVCRGYPAILPQKSIAPIESQINIKHYLDGFIQHMQSKGFEAVSVLVQAKFLAGMTVPIFARIRVKQLAGFGYCSEYRYQDIINYIDNGAGYNEK